jgi:hypothetical protein
MSEFYNVASELIELHDRKGAEYGNEAEPFANVICGAEFANVEPWVAAMLRASDKMGRLAKAVKGQTLTIESIDDNLADLATYTIIALCLHRRTQISKDYAALVQEEISGLWSDQRKAWYEYSMGWPEPGSDD